MTAPVIVFYTSGHGFGHATRDGEVIAALLAADRTVRVAVRTSAPPDLFPAAERVDVEHAVVDVGVVQRGSLEVDVRATAREAARFYTALDQRATDEAASITRLGGSIVVGDIPPLAFAAAARAGVPSVALANFTWDWIYDGYPEFGADAPGVAGVVREAYGRAARTLRLPFHGGFAAMRGPIDDIPLVARSSALGRDAVRRRLALTGTRPIVLASFGGHGAPIPYAAAARLNDVTLLVTDHETAEEGDAGGRLVRLPRQQLRAAGLAYPDLVAAADVVISKPGYGIVSECIANGAALLYARRGRFAEQQVFLTEMPQVLRCREISGEALAVGRWDDDIGGLLRQAAAPRTLATNGAEIAAREILATAGLSSGVR
jgi:L-arabinokinase